MVWPGFQPMTSRSEDHHANHYTIEAKVVLEGWAVTVTRLMLAVIFSITPFLYQSSSVCYAHSQMQKRSMVYLFWTMGYSDQAVRNKTFNCN